MAALTAPKNTYEGIGENHPQQITVSAQVFPGATVAVAATGKAEPASDKAGITVIGIAQSQGNTDGDVITFKRGNFFLDNDTEHPVTDAHIGSVCYVADDHTVSANGGTNSIAAGKVLQVTDEGVLVRIAL